VEGARLIHVDDDAELDLTHCARSPLPDGCFSLRSRPLRCEDCTLSIPPDTILASGHGRGGSRGALLSTKTYTTCPLIAVTGPGTRVTGLRIHAGASIINVGSAITSLTPPNSAVYSATKGAVDAITGVLAKEFGPRRRPQKGRGKA
jgi:hypothetical protein